jgi:hypothetical protein
MYFDGELDQCLAALDRALPAYERAGASDRFHRAIINRAGTLMGLGRHRESITLRRGILAIATEENDLRTAASVLVGLALEAGEWREALEQSLEAAALARRGGCGTPEMTALANAVEFAVETGAWSTADELLADLRSRPALPHQLADGILLDSALLAAYRGDQDGAQALLDQVSTETSKTVNSTMLAWYRRVCSVLRLLAGDLPAAFSEAIGALDAEAVEGPNSAVAASFAGRAALWLRDGDLARQALARFPVSDKAWDASARSALAAGVSALDGKQTEAAVAYDGVLSARLAADDPFTHALIALDATAVLPEHLVPEGAVASARAYLEELRAEALLSRLPSVSVRS